MRRNGRASSPGLRLLRNITLRRYAVQAAKHAELTASAKPTARACCSAVLLKHQVVILASALKSTCVAHMCLVKSWIKY